MELDCGGENVGTERAVTNMDSNMWAEGWGEVDQGTYTKRCDERCKALLLAGVRVLKGESLPS